MPTKLQKKRALNKKKYLLKKKKKLLSRQSSKKVKANTLQECVTIKQEYENDIDQFAQFFSTNINETWKEQDIKTQVNSTDNCYNDYIAEVEENKLLALTTVATIDSSMDKKLYHVEYTGNFNLSTQNCQQEDFSKSNHSFIKSECHEPTIKIETGDCVCEIKDEIIEADEYWNT